MSHGEHKPRRGRLRVALAAIGAAVALVIAGGAVAIHAAGSTTHYADAGRPVTVEARTVPSVGTVLVTGTGQPLYTYAPDKAGATSCAGICTLDWPALGVRSANDIVAGRGVDQHKLGTASRSGSLQVVTYGGRPLYTFASDRGADRFTGQGKDAYDGHWYAIRPSGAIVTTVQPAR